MAKRLFKALFAGWLGLTGLMPARAQDRFAGWTEITVGVPTSNIRLYPTIKITDKSRLSSLVDINGYWSFGKTDLRYDAISAGPLTLRPGIAMLNNSVSNDILPGLNATFYQNGLFGFVEWDANHNTGLNGSRLYTYILKNSPIGYAALFTASRASELKKTYMEIEAATKKISGIGGYARANLQKGSKPTYQIGLSINPVEAYNAFKK